MGVLGRQILDQLNKLSYRGKCNTGMSASATAIVSSDFVGFEDDEFNTKYFMQIIHNDNSVGASPELEVRQITDFVGSTGTFTVTAFGANVEAEDWFIILHESIVVPTADAANDVFVTDVVGRKTDAAVEVVGTTKSVQAYGKGLTQELAQRNVSKTVIVAVASVAWGDIVNITDKGVLTGLSQVPSLEIAADGAGAIRYTIDGTLVVTITVFSQVDATQDLAVSGCLSLNHRFDTSLRVEAKGTNATIVHHTTAAYTIDA